MSYDTTQFPISNATDSNYLHSQLGYFWQRIFKDKATIRGLTQAMASGGNQAYTDVFNSINSYSATNIPIFNTVNWYPLTITAADLDNNTLLFGEGVLFGATVGGSSYLFGSPIPEDTNVYSMIAPEGLAHVSIVADRILSPTMLWINGQTIKIVNGRIFFFGNPLATGLPVTYGDNGAQITLWCYNARVDDSNLYNNIGYLFGLDVDHSDSGKAILTSIVNLISGGASIANLSAICAACLGTGGGSYEVVDNLVSKNWWQTEITAGPNNALLPLYLPPHMFTVGYKNMLRFDNSVEPVSVTNGQLNFPVSGTPSDIQLFNSTMLNNTAMVTAIQNYLLHDLPSMINPVDFIFKSLLSSNTTLIKVHFASIDQLALFETVFSIIKNNLPKHVNLMFLCDITLPNDTYSFSTQSISDVVDTSKRPFPNALADSAYMNSKNSGPALLIQDMLPRRTIPTGVTTVDFPNLSFTIPPS